MDPNIIALLYIGIGCTLGVIMMATSKDGAGTSGEGLLLMIFCMVLWPLFVVLAPIVWLYEDDKKNNMGKRS